MILTFYLLFLKPINIYLNKHRFEQVLHLPGHKGPVWGLDVSRDGSCCVSGGQDRSLRMWDRGDDLVFVEEERERALASQADNAAIQNTSEDKNDNTVTFVDPVQSSGKKSLESVKSGEVLIEGIDMVEAEILDIEEHSRKALSGKHARLAPRAPNVQLLGLDPLAYLLRCIRMTKQPELEQTLLVLPFHYVTRLIILLVQMCERGIYDIELCCRCAVFLLRCHFAQIVSTRSLVQEIQKLQNIMRFNMGSLRDIVGTNLAGLNHMKRTLEQESQQQMGLDDALAAASGGVDAKKRGGTKKKKQKK
jgi:U3 small nucleolar RNA-associated protein 12